MLDHLGFAVADYPRSRAFYERALAPLGIGVRMDVTREMSGDYEGCGFGPEGGRPQFWVGTGSGSGRGGAGHGMHIAFSAKTRAEVDAFHAAALAAGGTDNGAPGLRPHYHPHYYGAFILDPEGNNIEAVCHQPEN